MTLLPTQHAIPIDLSGVRATAYLLDRSGRQSRGDVVFCHGTPWSAAVWADIAEAVKDNYRCLLWDMPGYGTAAKGEDVAVDIPTQSVRLTQLLDQFDIHRPHVVAHDIGGAVALGAHLMQGCDYAGLFLWDPVIVSPWGSHFFRLVAENQQAFRALPTELHTALVTAYISGAAVQPLNDDWLVALVAPWLGTEGQRAFYHQIASLDSEQTEPLADALNHIRCPVAIGWGADDPWLPAAQAQELQRLLPGDPSVTLLEQVGHLGPIEATEHVIRTIADWLADR